MAETIQEFILDLGSISTKFGIPDSTPQFIVPTVVGHFPSTDQSLLASIGLKNYYVGTEAFSLKELSSKAGRHQLEFPVQRGLIEKWNSAEKLISHALYNEARQDPRETALMMLEHPMTSSKSRETLASYLIEELGVGAFFFVNPATSALRATGRLTGVVLCSGGQSTYSMAIKDGKGILSSLMTLDIGLEDIVGSVAKSLTDRGPGNFVTRADRAEINNLLSTHGYVALDYEQEMKKTETEFDAKFTSGDGQITHFYHDTFKHYEVLFKPEIYGLEKDGIHNMIHATIQKCDPSLHGLLYSNITLAGGTTSVPGFSNRLKKELQLLAPKYSNYITIREDFDGGSERIHRSFRGASFFSATPECRNHLWITRYDYDEGGSNILEKQNPLGEY